MATTYAAYEDLLPAVSNQALLPILENLRGVAKESISKKLKGSYCIAYSAGIDSSILAKMASDTRGSTTLLTLGRESSSDLLRVESDTLANDERFRLVSKKVSRSDIESAALEVSKTLSVLSLSHFEDCVSFWLLASEAKTISGLEYIASANGPDELFCGYDRFRRLVDEKGYQEAEREIAKALNSAHALQRQVGEIVSKFGYSTVEPFLEESFKAFCIKIPVEYKILKGHDFLRKRVWRCLGRFVGVPDRAVLERKKAMQYGMGIHPVVLSLVKRGRIEIKSKPAEN